MDISVLFRLAAVGLTVAVLDTVLKKADRGEQALIVTVAGVIVACLILLDGITELFGSLRSVFGL